MGEFFRNLRLDIKVALLGIGSVLITAIFLVFLAVWQSGQYNILAQGEVDELINADLDHITEGVYNLVRTENEAVQQQVNYNLNVARHVLANTGSVSLSEETIKWTAVNQFTNEKLRIQMPRMLIGGRWLGQNSNPDIKTPVVDEITRLVGETATIFQRMNERGDMIRIATTIKDADGKRAIGTFIPAGHADGKPNPVTSAILKGKAYHGRAFAVNTWYLTAYEPIKDKAGRLVGMLYVGVKQKAVEMRIRHAILQTKVGKTGYVYVLGGKGEDRGRYIISQRGERDGEDIWDNKDSDGRYVIQTIINKAIALKSGELTTERYRWQNPGEPSPRWKIARLAYYEPWDWVIGTSVYEDELQSYRAVLSGGRIRMTTIMGLAGLMLVLVIGLFGVFIAWTITRPVGQLTRAAEIIMKGNLDHAVDIHSHDEIGKLAHTFNTMTERLRQTMEGLLKSEEKYRTLVETTLDLIFVVDRQGRFTFANPRLEALTGFTSRELQGRPFTDILTPEFREMAVDRFKKGIRGEIHSPYEVVIMDREGKETPVEFLTTTLFDRDGKPVGRFGVGRDMTERKKAADALQASQQKINSQLLFLEALLSAMPIPVFYKDADFRYLGCNEAYAEYMGIGEDELKGKTAYDIWPHELAEMYDLKDRELIQQRGAQTYEFKAKDKNSEIRDVIFRKSVFLNEDGSVGGILGAHFDITERKHAEEALKISEQRLAAFIDFLPDATLAIDKNKRIIIWNRAIEEMTGIPASEMIGKGDYAYTIPFYGVARPQLMDLFWEPEHEVTVKYPILKKEGENLVIEVFCPALYGGKGAFVWAKASPLRDSGGQLIGAIECIRDISERKQAEEMLKESESNYRSVIENIQDVFYRSDARGNLIMASPSFVTMLGYDSVAECLGRSISGTFYYDPEKRVEFLRTLKDKGRVTNYEVVLKRKDGLPVTVETNSHFYFDEDGNAAGVEGIFRDISKRKQDEDIRRKLESQLIQSRKMEAIGTLAGGIAHDFNNILAGIMGYTELYKDAVSDRPKVYHALEEVLKAAGRAKDLVTQILTFSRKTEHERKPVMLSPIIKEVVKFMRASLPATIEIRQNIDETSDIIMADPSQMHQVLMNLCTNAWYAMKDSGGSLEIRLKEIAIDQENLFQHKSLKPGRYLELSVRDTGRGISKENIDKIFDPYFTTKEKGEGTGLGLAVVHGIVKEYGGEIKVYSEIGKGTIFRVSLPLMEKQEKEISESEEVILPGKGETILFIDDEKMMVELNRELLESLGYNVIAETNPVQAIETFRKDSKAFDLVITDKTMPQLTGFDVAHEIKSVRADIPVIFCSGFQEKEDVEKLKVLGISKLIIKPIRKSVLAKAIREVLDNKQS
jgi:PAS domain S-box-containing protein